ncbi:Virus neck protein [compost metagenome]
MALWNNIQWASVESDDPRSLENIRNPHFNHFTVQTEKDLLNDIIAESIQFSGLEFYYIKREIVNLDRIFGEDTTNTFGDYWKVAMYLESYQGWQGQQDFYSKFGVSVADEVDLVIQPDLFAYQTGGYFPKPGDLIMWERQSQTKQPTLFEIIWVEADNPFHPNGTLPMRRITAQKFVASREKMPLINKSTVPDPNGTDLPADILDELIQLEMIADIDLVQFGETDQIQAEADQIVVFDEEDPFRADY